jgi:hypothetical protein
MKKYLLVFFFPLVFVSPLRAQLGLEMVTFIARVVATCDEGGYEYKQTLFQNRSGVLQGLKCAWAPGEKFTLGMSAYFGKNMVTPWYSNDVHKLTMSYATVYGEYHFRNQNTTFYNWSFLLHLGRGYSSVTGSGIPANFQSNSSYWVIEPGINFNISLLEIFRFNAGASYRILSGAHIYGQSDGSLSGPCLNFGLSLTGRGY